MRTVRKRLEYGYPEYAVEALLDRGARTLSALLSALLIQKIEGGEFA